MKPLKILHIEDSPADAGLINRELKKAGFDFTIKIVETRGQFLEALEQYKPDLILSDHSLPQFDSMEALKIYREKNCAIPFILITGSVSEEFAIRSIKEGADDYILKNNLIRLPAAIKQALKSRRVELERQIASLQLETTNKELNTFIYKAAHDLRGPLCSIMGLTNIASMDNEKNNLPDYIHKISESTHKLDAVLLSLIDVMAIKDAKPVIKEINFELLVDQIIERLKSVPDCKDIPFNINIETKKGFFSDENILSAIFKNMIENAVKYRTHDQEAFVAVRVFNIENGVQIEIEDNGIGIEEELQSQVFDMYFRGNLDSKGSGLGLYIVQNGVKKLGGTIDVKSELNKGSTFTVLLPAYMIHEN